MQAERLECKEKGVMVLVDNLWDAEKIEESMARHQGLFQRFVFDELKTQGYLLTSLEKLIEMKPDMIDKVPNLLKGL
jgi:hypothetical protein